VGAFIYVRSGGRWHLQAALDSPQPALFGAAVAISGSTVVIGAPGTNLGQGPVGAVYVYRRSGTQWRLRTTLYDPESHKYVGSQFGEAVALSGNTIVIGSSGINLAIGGAFIYHSSGSTWQLQDTISDPGGAFNDQFGASVAVSGPTVVIGAPGVHDFTGAAYIYQLSGSRWRRQEAVSIPRAITVAGGLGSVTAITGTGRNVLVLLSGESVSGLTLTKNRCGGVFEFARPAGRWRELARIADPRCSSYDEFGDALSVSGLTALVGAPGKNRNSGATYVLTLIKP
jgi:FG-GAP repeat